MPTVPIYQQTETLRPAFRQGIDVQANADDFGAATGRGLEAFGRGVSNLGDALAAVKAKEDEARAKEADNAFAGAVRDALYNPDGGFMHAEGRNAVDAWGGFQKRVEELRKEYGKGLSGGAAQLYSQASQARLGSTLQTGMIHVGSARKSWFKTASESRLNTFQEDAIAAYGDARTVDKNIAAGLSELGSRAQEEGWDADTLSNLRAEYVSTVRKGVVTRMVEDDAIAAEKYYNAHKDQFTGPDQYAIETAMREGLIVEKSKREAERILGAQGPVDATQGAYGPRVVGGGDLTMNLIRDKEGFRSSPYWDVNHFRVGYGSDTVTREDGSVLRTKPGMKITRADAERDLQRRTREFQAGIQRDIGAETWRALPPQAQAALTSVAYNYGSLPSNVAAAARSGDSAAIADAIRSRASDNGGVNRNRRNSEADLVIGRSSPGGSGAPSFVTIEDELAKISDPDVRDATRKRLNSMIEAQDKQRSAMQKQAEMELFAAVEQGGTPDDVSTETRLLAGMSSVSSAWNFHEARLKRGEPETDQELLYELRRIAAVDPMGFSERNLMEYRDRLDNSAFKELTDKQTSALGDQVKAVQTGQVYADAYSQAEGSLESVGLTTVGQDGAQRQEIAGRIARFNNTLTSRIDEFRETQQRVPNFAEVQQMINQLLLPVVIQEEKSIWNPTKTPWSAFSERDAFAFEARYRPDGTRVDVIVEYQDIPIELRSAIARDLELENGAKPSPDEVVERYERFVLSQ